MKTLNLDLNYNGTTEENATLRIRLPSVNGKQLPYVYFRGKDNNGKVIIKVEDIDSGEAVWGQDVYIDFKTVDEDYRTLVLWWFNKAHDNEEYRENVIMEPFKELKDVNTNINNAANWLLTTGTEEVDVNGRHLSRKKDLHKFLTNRLMGDLKEQKKGK
jgi:hypothetical protein